MAFSAPAADEPTAADIARYSESCGVELTPADISDELARVNSALAILGRIDGLEVPRIPLKYARRDPGRAPVSGEDPYHAIIRFCEVKGAESGALRGTRVGVKDNIAVAGVPMTGGDQLGPPLVPSEDAVVIERLLDAGATVVAKTNINIDDRPAFGVTLNPVNPRFTAGASSSGSAAAVAAGLVDAALGADQGGSLRTPASWCGIVGMKATHGLVPSYGLMYWDHTLDHIGPLTRTVAENAALLQVLAGADWRDPQWVRGDLTARDYAGQAGAGITGLRIGVVSECLEVADCTPPTTAAFERAQAALSRLGADIRHISVPLWVDAATLWLSVVTSGLTAMTESFGCGGGHLGRVNEEQVAAAAARARAHGTTLPSFPFGPRTLPLVLEHLRAAHSSVPLVRAHNLRLELRRQIDRALDDVDVLITPTVRRGPEEVGELAAEGEPLESRLSRVVAGFVSGMSTTCPLNLSGHPALTVPSGPGDHGLPTGLQIIGRHFDEGTVYRVGFAFEAVQPAASSMS